MNWFEVDKQGLAKLLERRGKAFAITELIQNAWDTNAKHVRVNIAPIAHSPHAFIEVIDDDPNGFSNLAHAFTLFAESAKKGDATKRGRFNLGEKLVLALCIHAKIQSTTGTVTFDNIGRRSSKKRTSQGSSFEGVIKMTRDEYAEVCSVVLQLIPPDHVETVFNDVILKHRDPIGTFEVALPTEVADEEGVLKRTIRKTVVRIYEPNADETPSIYELGIPVVTTEDRWHVDVSQKVPLNFDRDNVPPAYLRQLRVHVLNHMHDLLQSTDANQTWVRDAGSDKLASDEAIINVMTLRFGDKRVIYDPSDPEANNIAVTKGYTVVHGGTLNADEWANVKRSGAILAAGVVTPSPKPYSQNGQLEKLIEEKDWTPAIRRVVEHAKIIAQRVLLISSLDVRIINEPKAGFLANYSERSLGLNIGTLGKIWFEEFPITYIFVDSLLIHEFAHHYERNHLSHKFHDATCRIGAAMIKLALREPNLWKK